MEDFDVFQKYSADRNWVCAIVRNRIPQGRCKGCFMAFIMTDISEEALRKALRGIAEFDRKHSKTRP